VQVLNQIVFELLPDQPLADIWPLREFLGHTTPPDILKVLLWCFLALMNELEIFTKAQYVINSTCHIEGRAG
jgi:hypothetical protein